MQLRVKKRMRNFTHVNESAEKLGEKKNKLLFKGAFDGIRGRIKAYAKKRISFKKELGMDKRLLQAGSPMNMKPVDFHIVKVLIRIFMPLIFVCYGKILGLSYFNVLFAGILGLIIGFIAPNYYISSKIKNRFKIALKELPDFLDILTVCLEAGLGFDSALSKIISKKTGILPYEFRIYLEELRLGKTRREALIALRERLDLDEIKALVSSLLQAEKLGISIVQILRVKSQEEREKRKQRAEEAAMKAPIKILFPLVLFIFPSIFIIILGPVVIQIINEFSK
jgi:tight adherence protein C